MKRGNGFTLVETLITLSLAVFLLLVVWRMFDVYTKIENKGVSASQKAAVVRAVQRQLRSDLRRLVYIDPTQPAPTQVAGSEHSLYPTNGYLFGTSTELSFVTFGSNDQKIQRVISYIPQRRDARRQREVLQRANVEDESVAGVIRVDQSWIAFQKGRSKAGDDFSRFAAGRKIDLQEGDFLVIGQSQPNQREYPPLATKPEIRDLIPEIESWRFRYFDGGWRDRWDSSWHRRLPKAIEISFDMDMTGSGSQEKSREAEFVLSSKAEPLQHRFVISLGLNPSFTVRGMP